MNSAEYKKIINSKYVLDFGTIEKTLNELLKTNNENLHPKSKEF